jgi:Fe-S-cluster containining protein
MALFIIYSLKRLACVTFPRVFEERKKKTKYIMHTWLRQEKSFIDTRDWRCETLCSAAYSLKTLLL